MDKKQIDDVWLYNWSEYTRGNFKVKNLKVSSHYVTRM